MLNYHGAQPKTGIGDKVRGVVQIMSGKDNMHFYVANFKDLLDFGVSVPGQISLVIMNSHSH